MHACLVYGLILHLNLVVLMEQVLFTESGSLPDCPETNINPTDRRSLSGLYASKRLRLHPTIYNVNEQFAPNIHLPWYCSLQTFWKDLGEDNFPRFVKDGLCVSVACWYGHYVCRPVVYKMNVIYRQYHNRCNDRNLPIGLSTDWNLGEVNITVACICARN